MCGWILHNGWKPPRVAIRFTRLKPCPKSPSQTRAGLRSPAPRPRARCPRTAGKMPVLLFDYSPEGLLAALATFTPCEVAAYCAILCTDPAIF